MDLRFKIFILGFIVFLIPNAFASDNNSCIDCHKTLNPFVQEEQQFNQIRIEHLERNVSCSLECHADRIRQLATSNYQQWSESLHALKKVTCDVCHGGDPNQTIKDKAHVGIKNSTDINSSVYYTNVPNTCGKCHNMELANFENSAHYKKLESLQTAPTCTTCHAPHMFSILNPEDFRNFCGNCHSVYKKIAPYDVPVQAEYLLNKVNKLKFDIQTAQDDIFLAKKNGTDVTQAEQYVNNSLETVENLTVMWHEFNLTHFDNETDSAINQVKMAEDIINRTDTTTPTSQPTSKVTGFDIELGIISLLAILFFKMKLRKE